MVDESPFRVEVALVGALTILIDVYTLILFVSILGSWVQSDNEIFRIARQLTEPVLAPIRKALPPAGGFDLSPLLLLIGLSVLRSVLH